MLYASLTSNTTDLEQILALQQQNLPANIDKAEMQSEGFVTLRHDLATLEQMHRLAPSVIIKDDERVVAYALTMLRECSRLVPALDPMFDSFDQLTWDDRPLKDHRFYVMGQICIAKAYRGKGLVEQLYEHHKNIYQSKFDLIVTEIAIHNPRSLRAHEKVGFKIIHSYLDKLDEWNVVAWNWS